MDSEVRNIYQGTMFTQMFYGMMHALVILILIRADKSGLMVAFHEGHIGYLITFFICYCSTLPIFFCFPDPGYVSKVDERGGTNLQSSKRVGIVFLIPNF